MDGQRGVLSFLIHDFTKLEGTLISINVHRMSGSLRTAVRATDGVRKHRTSMYCHRWISTVCRSIELEQDASEHGSIRFDERPD